ncbi:hypothetical protein [Amycolatopsis sp. ATCC 39116]|uniref:hypothetical protein n=1 Tax=Amycolatopsis sp. (strain ATCC 39116 / 75iv2) TaxID=385957 RepID=UPI000262590D|nr:hypothetical protein [Amycolatopsis sp. ATCC 39116]
MIFAGTTVPGGAGENEDWLAATPDLVVVLDGATVRTETGCHHGPAWYTRKLGAAIIAAAADRQLTLGEILSTAIAEVTQLHPECDLTRPGAPSAGVAIVRDEGTVLRYLVLGDITIAADVAAGIKVISDDRVSSTALAERAAADRHLIGTPEKAAALIKMKEIELAAQNHDGGYWIASADPTVVDHAIAGEFRTDDLRQFALLSDGAARLVTGFGFISWDQALDLLATAGPAELINRTRAAEEADPLGERYPRNKKSDDATVVYARI